MHCENPMYWCDRPGCGYVIAFFYPAKFQHKEATEGNIQIALKKSIGYFVFLLPLGWHVYIETPLDCGEYRVQCAQHIHRFAVTPITVSFSSSIRQLITHNPNLIVLVTS